MVGKARARARGRRARRAGLHRRPPATGQILGRVRQAGAVSRNRVLRRFWISQMLSEIGDWVGLLGIAALLYHQTGQALLASASLGALYLPYLFAPWLVGLCARIPPRTLLVGADFLRAGLIMMLVLPLPPWVLLGLVFLASVPTSVYEATRAAAVPEYAPDPDTQDDALVLFQSTQQAATMVGFLLGGAALAFIGFQAAIVVNAVSFLLSGLLLVRVPYLGPFVDSGHSAFRLAKAAAVALRVQPVLRRTFLFSIVSASTIMAGEALVVVYGAESGHSGLAGPLAASSAAVAAVLALMLPRHLGSEALLRVSAFTMVIGSLTAIGAFAVHPAVLAGFIGYVGLGIISAPGALLYVVAVREMGPAVRAPVFALAQVGLMGGQAAVAVMAGHLADVLSVGSSIALWQIPTGVLAVVWFVIGVKAKPAPVALRQVATDPELPQPSAEPAVSAAAGVHGITVLPATR